MALFYNRPLALSCVLLVCTVFLSLLLGVWFGIALFLLAGIAFIVLLSVSYKKPLDHRRLALLLITGAVMLSSLRICADHLFVKNEWDDKMETTVVAELRVKEIRFTSAYQTELYADAVTLDGDRMKGSAVVRADSALSLCEGDRVRTTCEVHALDFESEHKGMTYTYRGDGARAVLIVRDGVTLEKSGASSPRAFLAQLRAALSYRILSVCGDEEGSLLSAMLLGTRSALPDKISRNFSRAGVSHLLALSGLHLSFIVLLLDNFLLLFYITKKRRIPIILAVCVLYLLLTGFSYSMLRAIFMLIFVFLAFFAREEQDGLTSLCFSAAIMLLVTPNAIFSVSFCLTFLATLGILIVAELTQDIPRELPKRGAKRQLMRAVYAIRASIFVSAASLLSVLVVQWLTFGEMSLMTPLSNLLLVPLAPSLLVGGIAALILPIAPIGFIAALPARLMLFLTSLFARPRAVISLEYDFVPYILIPLFAATLIFLLVDLGKRRWIVCIPAALAIVSFALCITVTGLTGASEPTLIYNRENANEGIVLTQNGKAIVCDVSNGSSAPLSSDMNVVREANITEIDTLILTHYHKEHVYSVARFCSRNTVRTLLLPTPMTEADASVMARIQANAERLHIPVSLYHYDTPIPVLNGSEITVHATADTIEQSHRAFAITASHEGDAICYHSATHLPFDGHDCSAKTLLLGVHGANTSRPISPLDTYEDVWVCDEHLHASVYAPENTAYKTAKPKQKFCLHP